jgi:hypothetical protein
MADPRSGAGSVIRSVEFYNIELAPLADGRVYVSMLATTATTRSRSFSRKKSRATPSRRSTTHLPLFGKV